MNNKLLVIATRLHLGNASAPPEESKLQDTVRGFAEFCAQNQGIPVIAVDATPKLDNYDYVQAVQQACSQITDEIKRPQIVPVTPWGKFVPALNALISHAMTHQSNHILFVSAETRAPTHVIQQLCQHIDNDTLVAGAVLAGHDYHPDQTVALSGRTTPWNTLAVWNLSKLALTGFQLVSEGLLTDNPTEPSYGGVEEVVAIAVLQQLLGPDQAKAKLVKCEGIEWNIEFDGDEERRQWHERKMTSKVERPQRQLQLLGISGSVYHC